MSSFQPYFKTFKSNSCIILYHVEVQQADVENPQKGHVKIQDVLRNLTVAPSYLPYYATPNPLSKHQLEAPTKKKTPPV